MSEKAIPFPTREEQNEAVIADQGRRIAQLRKALLSVILAYDDHDGAPDPEKALSDAIQSARAVWRG